MLRKRTRCLISIVTLSNLPSASHQIMTNTLPINPMSRLRAGPWFFVQPPGHLLWICHKYFMNLRCNDNQLLEFALLSPVYSQIHGERKFTAPVKYFFRSTADVNEAE